MKKINNYILEKFKISKDIKEIKPKSILVFDTENELIFKRFDNEKDAQACADYYDRYSNHKRVIKSEKRNYRFIVINLNNPSDGAKECIKEWPEILELEEDK